MRKTSLIAATALTLLPLSTFAHGHTVYEIGGQQYQFTVGSLNEPVAVDDKSGVELQVERVTGTAADHGHEAGAEDETATEPVTGLESTLKVEVSAGDKKKEMALSPVFGEPGSYRAIFIPTIQTTYTYRFFGTINNVAVDLSFTCNPAGHTATPDDHERKEISPGVFQLEKTGTFGCPTAKADLGFPEAAPTLSDLGEKKDDGVGSTALVFGILGFVTGSAALQRTRKNASQ